MKNIRLYIILLLLLAYYNSHGQFDKKFTCSAFAGTTLPVGTRLDADSVPYVFTNFRNGFQAGIGGQYNITPRFSAGLNIVALIAVNYKNPIPTPAGKEDIISSESNNYTASYFTNLSLGISARYKMFRSAKFNPYVYGEINANSYAGQVAPRLQYYEQKVGDRSDIIQEKYTILRYNAKQIASSVAVGANLGLGIDIKLSDSFTLMAQSGYNVVFTASDSNLRRNLDYINFQTGLRFSLFRSKSIL